MKCGECGHFKKGICSNPMSENHNIKVNKEYSCEHCESQEAIDYYKLTPWQFANKYYK